MASSPDSMASSEVLLQDSTEAPFTQEGLTLREIRAGNSSLFKMDDLKALLKFDLHDKAE